MRKLITTHRSRFLVLSLFAVLGSLAACNDGETDATPSLRPTRVIDATATPKPDEVAKARITEIFNSQIAAIQRSDWGAVYQTCSPNFRSARDLERYVQDASSQFARDGYIADGFEARNVEPFVRASDRVRVRWDAYQDGNFVRTEEIGEIYVFTQGNWFDDGAWCR